MAMPKMSPLAKVVAVPVALPDSVTGISEVEVSSNGVVVVKLYRAAMPPVKTSNQLSRSAVGQGQVIRTVTSQGAFPGHDAGHFVGLSVASQGAVAHDFLGGASRTNTTEGNTQAVGHGVLDQSSEELCSQSR